MHGTNRHPVNFCADPQSYHLGIPGIVAVVDNGADGVTNAGDEVALSYSVTNTGNTCLGDIVLDDPSTGTLECTAEFSGKRANTEKKWVGKASRQDSCGHQNDLQILVKIFLVLCPYVLFEIVGIKFCYSRKEDSQPGEHSLSP